MKSIILLFLIYSTHAYRTIASLSEYEECLRSESSEKIYELAIYGDPNAQLIIADECHKKTSYKEARMWYEESSKAGNLMAQETLAMYYAKGLGGDKNEKAAFDIHWYFANAKNSALHQYYIASSYDRGIYVKRDLNQAVHWYSLSADGGYAPAQYAIGDIYENGDVVKKDLKLAKYYYELAAKQGNANAIGALRNFK